VLNREEKYVLIQIFLFEMQFKCERLYTDQDGFSSKNAIRNILRKTSYLPKTGCKKNCYSSYKNPKILCLNILKKFKVACKAGNCVNPGNLKVTM
jgi:hypothetical protein